MKDRGQSANGDNGEGAEVNKPISDRFVARDLRMSLCGRCKHKHGRLPECDAYPEGIPMSFLDGTDKHTRSFEGDHGVLFEAMY